jgi:transcriptional regulator with XRE-family HTH domain
MSREKFKTETSGIGERIKSLRKSKGLSGEAFAKSFEKTKGWLSQVERGKLDPPASIVMLIERTYGVNLRTVGTHDYRGPERRKNLVTRRLIDKAIAVLASDHDLIRTALKQNILAFHRVLEDHKKGTPSDREKS